MGLTLRDCLYESTTSKVWICLIEGRILVGNGSRSYKKSAWLRKADVAQVFKHSKYWKHIKIGLKTKYPNIPETEWIGQGYVKAKWIMKNEYNRLLNEGVVQYIEITPTPQWFNC